VAWRAVGVEELVHADAVDAHYRQAREPRTGVGFEQAPGGVARRFEQGRIGAVDVDGGEDDRAARRLTAGAALDRSLSRSETNQRLTTPSALPLPARLARSPRATWSGC
jgi:hypothetical protein